MGGYIPSDTQCKDGTTISDSLHFDLIPDDGSADSQERRAAALSQRAAGPKPNAAYLARWKDAPDAAVRALALAEEQQRRREAARHKERETVLSRIAATTPPRNFQKEIDNYVGEILIDPESRRVTLETPKGGLVCGLVNARNRAGGYVGRSRVAAVYLDGGLTIYMDPGSPLASAEDFRVAQEQFRLLFQRRYSVYGDTAEAVLATVLTCPKPEAPMGHAPPGRVKYAASVD